MSRQFVLATLLFSFAAFPLAAQVIAARPAISVSGTAEIRVAPDEVKLRLGVETRDLKLDEAVKQSESRTAAVLKFLRESGIDAKDLQTDFVVIHPQYDPDQRRQITPDFYLVRRNFGVRLRNVTQFDAILEGVLKNGVNHVEGVEFHTTELRKHRDAARQQAIRAAREKAQALAQELDAKLGKPESIQEQTSGGWWGWTCTNANITNVMFQNTTQLGSTTESADGNLAVGLISISATITVTFALE